MRQALDDATASLITCGCGTSRSAARVDSFVANSETVARRIRRYYGVNSIVIHPPVDTVLFQSPHPSELEDYYLMAGELVSYKRPDLAVRAFQ